jgi:hypothetical protein
VKLLCAYKMQLKLLNTTVQGCGLQIPIIIGIVATVTVGAIQEKHKHWKQENFNTLTCRGVRVTKITGSTSDDWIY